MGRQANVGDDTYANAVTRALNVMERARPDDAESPFDEGEELYAALKPELQRLLQAH